MLIFLRFYKVLGSFWCPFYVLYIYRLAGLASLIFFQISRFGLISLFGLIFEFLAGGARNKINNPNHKVDIDLIKKVYSEMSSRIEHAKKIIGKPLTLTEKVLYSHLWNNEISNAYERGADYVDFSPDRVTCQDATAQMALLQFMQAGKQKVAVPTTVHCDHLILAQSGAKKE